MSEYLNETVGYQMQGTAEWRRRKAQQFPDDTRNIAAAEELERLAAEIDALNESPIEKQIGDAERALANYGWEDVWMEINETISDALRSIGFHDSYDTGTEFLEWYRDLLNEKLHELIDQAVPSPDLARQVQDNPAVKAAKRAYDEACAKALAEARKTL